MYSVTNMMTLHGPVMRVVDSVNTVMGENHFLFNQNITGKVWVLR